jgi:hypothetical protein
MVSIYRNAKERIFYPVQCDMPVCSVVNFATVYLYLQEMNLKVNDLGRVAEDALGMCVPHLEYIFLPFIESVRVGLSLDDTDFR